MVSIDMDDEEKFLTSETGFDRAVVHEFMLGQKAFYMNKGIIVFNDLEPFSEPSNEVIDNDEMCDYIAKLTDLRFDVCEVLSFANLKYLSQNGLTSDSPVEYDALDRLVGKLNPSQRRDAYKVLYKVFNIQ